MVIAAVQHETYGSECYQLRVCICVCVLSLLAGFCGYNSFLADIFLDDPTFEKSVISSIRTLIHYVQHQITSSGEKSLTHLPVQLIPGPGQLILEPAPSHDGSSIHLASKLDVCSHICVAIHTSSILPLWRLSCCCPDLTLPCRHMEEQWCPGLIQNNIIPITMLLFITSRKTQHSQSRQPWLKYQAVSLTIQLRYVSFVIYSFTSPSF